MFRFQHEEMQAQRAAMEQQRLETLATEKRVEDLYSEIQQLRGEGQIGGVKGGVRGAVCGVSFLVCVM